MSKTTRRRLSNILMNIKNFITIAFSAIFFGCSTYPAGMKTTQLPLKKYRHLNCGNLIDYQKTWEKRANDYHESLLVKRNNYNLCWQVYLGTIILAPLSPLCLLSPYRITKHDKKVASELFGEVEVFEKLILQCKNEGSTININNKINIKNNKWWRPDRRN